MTYVITANHPLFDRELVMERGVPTSADAAQAWVLIYLMRNIPQVDWFDQKEHLQITVTEEV